ncbi:DUF1349 domain-containing protein (plasmid) [Fibrella sp. ES10-3-2-2]
MIWYNEPTGWSGNADQLTLTVEPATDYWRTTHYGFIRDTGPFYYQEVSGDFEASVQVTGLYTELFHQAGLVVRLDAANWIKTGIEYVGGTQQVSAVVTRDVSDWSVVPCPDNPKSLWLKLVRKKDYVEISYSFDQQLYRLLRLAYFPPQQVAAQIGLVTAAPGAQAFDVTFDHFQVQAAP